MKKRLYLKRIGKIGRFAVWEVDGFFIRTRIERDFTNFGQHYRFRFIPKYEFWIDMERVRGEEYYFMDHMLVEWRLMNKGKSYEHALEMADRLERRERAKSRLMKRCRKRANHKDETIRRIHRRLIKRYSDGIKIWIVNGELVRDLFFIDFSEGGHDKVYWFVPKNEVWIDDDVIEKERKFVLLHELHERNLMKRGMKYHEAHRSANNVEYFARHHKNSVEGMMRKELRLNTDRKRLLN